MLTMSLLDPLESQRPWASQYSPTPETLQMSHFQHPTPDCICGVVGNVPFQAFAGYLNSFLYYYYHIYLWGKDVYHKTRVEVREQLSGVSSLFYYVGSRNQTLVIRLIGQHLYPLSHFA